MTVRDASPLTDAERLARLAHQMANPPFQRVLAPEAVRAGPGEVEVRLAFRPEFSGAHSGPDFFHGGVLASLVDMVAHATLAVELGRPVGTIDLRVDYLRPAPAAPLTAIGRLVSAGRSIGRADVDIRTQDGRTVATGRCVFSTKEAEKSRV